MKEFDLTNTVKKLQDSFDKDTRRAGQFGLGDSLEEISPHPEDYVVMDDWWKKQYGVLGIPFGKGVEISGKPDAGKTSLALVAIRKAQEQGYGVIYCETEGKTGPQDLIEAGINPNGVISIRTNITEEMFEGINDAIDIFFDDYPEEKLLLVLDSFGNTTSMRDSELRLTEKGAKVGGAGQINRLGLGAIKWRQDNHPIATLVVNYSYANIGSVGETNAGGRALEFLCMLVINASRKAWYERTVQGKKVRAGADVLWRTTKNHFAKSLNDEDGNQILLPKEIVLRISADGMNPVIPKKKKEEK